MHWVTVHESTLVADRLLSNGANVNARDEDQRTPLMWATERPNHLVASWLIEHGAEVNAVDERGVTALHYVAELGEEDLVRALLNAGADHSVRAEGHTPRSIAQHCEHVEVVRILSDAGAAE
jgi:ankyrin repeat protein